MSPSSSYDLQCPAHAFFHIVESQVFVECIPWYRRSHQPVNRLDSFSLNALTGVCQLCSARCPFQPFWQLAGSFYSTSPSTNILYSLERCWDSLQTRWFHWVCLLFSTYKNVNWILCEDLFLREHCCLYFSSRVISSYPFPRFFPIRKCPHFQGYRFPEDRLSCSPLAPSIKPGTQRGSINHLNEFISGDWTRMLTLKYLAGRSQESDWAKAT